MAQYYVKTLVTFTGTIEADSEAEAEEIGYHYDNLNYDGVYEVEVEEIEEDEEDNE
jgi:starvation-inducible outer membrane lipoprotein